MIQRVTHVALFVRDQQEAVDWYTEKLGFEVRSDEPFPDNPDYRWVSVAPSGQRELEIILQPPEWGPEEEDVDRLALVGQAPGFVLMTEDLEKTYEELSGRGVQFVGEPMEVPWGLSAMFVDLYGYVHNLVEPRQ